MLSVLSFSAWLATRIRQGNVASDANLCIVYRCIEIPQHKQEGIQVAKKPKKVNHWDSEWNLHQTSATQSRVKWEN